MVISLRKLIKAAMADYETKLREEWVTLHSSQVGGMFFFNGSF